MAIHTWLAFCALELVLCLTPGPAVLLVSGATLTGGSPRGLRAALGVVLGNMFYFVLSGTGLAALILASHELFLALKWVGAAYLVWQGARMLLSRSSAEVGAAPARHGHAVLQGLAGQIGNPKALYFFVALLPPFLDPHAPLGIQLAILGLSSAVIEFAVLGAYIGLAARVRAGATNRWGGALRRAGGAALIVLGARLALAEDNDAG